ncbi:hypothetical protein VTN00DRAFT_4339 [Thermoascus crustaceus]|uniref:uncharacterized protein n=1 Tax=Thermoascus crustaceus TaxID=5088 RepID=UPI0037431E75
MINRARCGYLHRNLFLYHTPTSRFLSLLYGDIFSAKNNNNNNTNNATRRLFHFIRLLARSSIVVIR